MPRHIDDDSLPVCPGRMIFAKFIVVGPILALTPIFCSILNTGAARRIAALSLPGDDIRQVKNFVNR